MGTRTLRTRGAFDHNVITLRIIPITNADHCIGETSGETDGETGEVARLVQWCDTHGASAKSARISADNQTRFR